MGIDGFRPQRPGVAVDGVGVGQALVIGTVGGGIDIGGGDVGHE